MKAFTFIWLGAFVLLTSVSSPPAAESGQLSDPAHDALRTGLAKAKADSRSVFLLYGYPACAPCRAFEAYLASPEIKQVFEKYFVLVKIDTVNMPDGEQLQAEHGPPGAPSWAVLNPAGRVLQDSDDGAGNVGYPSYARGLAQFVKALETARPAPTQADIALLTAKLKEGKPSAITPLEPERSVARDSGLPQHPDLTEEIGFKTLSLLNGSVGGVQGDGDQAGLLGVAMIVNAQRALVGTWTNKDSTMTVFTEGTPPVTRLRLSSAVVRLHLLWSVEDMTASASACAVARSPAITQIFTFKLADGVLHSQKVVIFTDKSGRPNQIINSEFKKR